MTSFQLQGPAGHLQLHTIKSPHHGVDGLRMKHSPRIFTMRFSHRLSRDEAVLANVESWNQSRWGWVVGRGRNPRANTAECKEHTHTYTQERTKVHGHGPAKDSLVVFLKLNSSSWGSHRKDQTLLPKKFLPTFERARAANIWGNGSLLSSLSDIKAAHTEAPAEHHYFCHFAKRCLRIHHTHIMLS